MIYNFFKHRNNSRWPRKKYIYTSLWSCHLFWGHFACWQNIVGESPIENIRPSTFEWRKNTANCLIINPFIGPSLKQKSKKIIKGRLFPHILILWEFYGSRQKCLKHLYGHIVYLEQFGLGYNSDKSVVMVYFVMKLSYRHHSALFGYACEIDYPNLASPAQPRDNFVDWQ